MYDVNIKSGTSKVYYKIFLLFAKNISSAPSKRMNENMLSFKSIGL